MEGCIVFESVVREAMGLWDNEGEVNVHVVEGWGAVMLKA